MDKMDEITMCIMGNNIYNGKIKEKKEENYSILNKEELFYRKRLIFFYKNLFKDQSNKDKSFIKEFHNFNKLIINNFKEKDKNELIQQMIIGKQENEEKKNKLQTINNSEFIINESNKILNKDDVKKCTLDNYVLKKPNQFKKKMVVPKKLNIDINKDSYKTKGIKKKNIDNNYEDGKK